MIRKRTNGASLLRHRLTLQQEVRAADGIGGYSKSWQNMLELWAEIIPVSGAEKLFGGQQQSSATHRIIVRYREDISPGQRLVFEKRIFNIRYVHFDNDNKQTLELFAEEGVAT